MHWTHQVRTAYRRTIKLNLSCGQVPANDCGPARNGRRIVGTAKSGKYRSHPNDGSTP
jgi:hypothetical protein